MIYAIDVTAEDIALGRRGQCNACPIALAVRQKARAACFVNEYSVSIWRDGECVRAVYTPLAVSSFVKSFDNGCTVQPLSFSVEFPE